MIKLSNQTRQARMLAIINEIDKFVASGYIEIYTGTMPPLTGATTSQIKLSTLVFSTVSALSVNGVMTFETVADDTLASGTGTASWCRVKNGNHEIIFDADCGLIGSSAFSKFDTLSIITGGTVSLTSMELTDGN